MVGIFSRWELLFKIQNMSLSIIIEHLFPLVYKFNQLDKKNLLTQSTNKKDGLYLQKNTILIHWKNFM